MRGSDLDREAVEAEIDRVRSLGFDELRALWRTTLRSSPPSVLSKDLVARFLCWHLQEQALGGLDANSAKLLDGLSSGDNGAADRPRRLKPGTVLVREYQGERHTVTACARRLPLGRQHIPEPHHHRAGHYGDRLERPALLWRPA
jgi:hypothetical protein